MRLSQKGARRLRGRMRRLEWKPHHLAQATAKLAPPGLSATTVWRVVNNKVQPSPMNLTLIQKALDAEEHRRAQGEEHDEEAVAGNQSGTGKAQTSQESQAG